MMSIINHAYINNNMSFTLMMKFVKQCYSTLIFVNSFIENDLYLTLIIIFFLSFIESQINSYRVENIFLIYS